MPVHHSTDEVLLDFSLESILFNQTLKPREIVIIGDGYLPNKVISVIDKYKKELIETELYFFQLERNYGIAYALNFGLKKCNYEFIARMDSDDIAFPYRLEVQLDAIITHNVSICGGWSKKISYQGHVLGTIKFPQMHSEIINLLWSNPISHPTVLMRKKDIVEVGSYNPKRKNRDEDWDLWIRCIKSGLRFYNIQKELIYFRLPKNNINKRSFKNSIFLIFLSLRSMKYSGVQIKAMFFLTYVLITGILPGRLIHLLNSLLEEFDPRRK